LDAFFGRDSQGRTIGMTPLAICSNSCTTLSSP
jgi:wyosine [tRNA(Phe)-imidazoG37] synthetase (radical SAM superfamily)